MPKQDLKLEQREGYYHLIPPKQTVMAHVVQFVLRLIKLPYNVYQTTIGRLLSYLVINPLFRKEEEDESLILQHAQFPDPLFKELDEMYVINVIPKKNIVIRSLLNWHNFFTNHTTAGNVAFSLLNRIVSLFPSGESHIDNYLDKLISKIESKLKREEELQKQPMGIYQKLEENKGIFQSNQIHFRGMEQLNKEQQERFYQKLKQRLHYDFSKNKDKIYFYSLQTADNAVLDSVEIRGPSSAHQNIEDRHFIISSMPRSNNYIDWLKHYQVYAKELDATVIAFNYRGVGLSKGVVSSEQNLYDDAYSQARRLLELGAKPENIALMGECLGGNVATHTAGRLQSEGFPVKLYNARSFRSLTAIIEARNLPSKDESLWNPLSWLKWTKYGIVKCIITPIIISAQWSLNIDTAFSAIPPQDRDFLVVRSKKDKQGKRFADDKMVPHKQASVYSLAKENRAAVLARRDRGEKLLPNDEAWIQDIPNQHKFYVSEDKLPDARKANGHTVHPRYLVNTNPLPESDNNIVDGRQYTLNFFKKIWPERQRKPDLGQESAEQYRF